MLLFNLLPIEKKEKLKGEKNVRTAVLWGWSFAGLLAFFVFLLLPSYFIASFQRQEILRNLALTEQSSVVRRIADIRQSLTILKQNISDIEKISKETGVFSGIIADVVQALPSGIIPTAIQFDAKRNEATIYGLANRRSSLVALDIALRSLSRVGSVSVPLSDLVQEADIPFSLIVTIEKQ